MKKILFLMLFLTGIMPVFKNNTLHLCCSQVYSQDPSNGGELDNVIICTGEKSETVVEDNWQNEYDCTSENIDGIATNPCEWNCILKSSFWLGPTNPCDDPSYTGPECGGNGCENTCGHGYELDINCNCIPNEPEPEPDCPTSCPRGYELVNCNCIPNEPPCPTSCTPGYELINCNCIREEQPCPDGFEKDVYGNCVKSPCRNTCPSGHKRNETTCECELLPPCFGTTVDGLMPDGSGDQSKLVEALESMVNNFFKSGALLDTMKAIGVLNEAELSKGFDNYIKGGDLLGKLSIAFVANDYNNNPTTENFMKIFVEGALLLLPPPASVGYTALDTTYQKYFDGKPFSEILAKKMAEKSAELFNCDLGSGVYGMFH